MRQRRHGVLGEHVERQRHAGQHSAGRRCDGRNGRRHRRRGRGRRDPRGDGRALPGRRQQRAQRADRVGRRTKRHQVQLRRRLGRGGRHRDHGRAQGVRPQRRQRHAARRGRDLPVALRPRGPLLAVRRRDRRRELPPRRPGGRRRGQPDLHDDLPGLLRRSLAAHALRGLREPRQGDQRRQQAAHLAAGAAGGGLQRRLRDGGLRAERHEPEPAEPGLRRHLQRRLLPADGEGDRLGRGGLHGHAQRAGADRPVRPERMAGCRPPCPREILPRPTGPSRSRHSPRSARARSGSTSTCPSAASAAATATSTPTPPSELGAGRRPGVVRRPGASEEVRLARRGARRGRSDPRGHGLPRRRHPHPAAGGRPRPAAARDQRRVRAGPGRREVTTEANPDSGRPRLSDRAARGRATRASPSACSRRCRRCSRCSTARTTPSGSRSVVECGPRRPASTR